MLWIACVEHGDYLGRGREYVNVLHDMCKRSLRREHRFVCFTDNPEGLDEGIETRPLPGNLAGWFNKLYMFAPGHFPDGDRVLFLDLDTIVMGGLEKLADYDGAFIMLRDFYRPHGYGSGLMAWKAGFGAHIWQSFVEAGYPRVPGGDQAWIESRTEPDAWQDRYPGRVVSYKAHCKNAVPDGAWVVCFHGEPRPHDCNDDYLAQFWKVGGKRLAEFQIGCNTLEEQILSNIRHAISLDIPWIRPGMVSGHMVVVGGGPSLADNYRSLRRRKKTAHIWAMNAVHDWLIERKIVPDACALLDARIHTVEFVRNPHPDVTYFVGSQCHPDVFEALKGFKVYLWHGSPHPAAVKLLEEEVGETRPWMMTAGGSSVGILSMVMGYMIGYRGFHLYGMDSSYRDGANHAYRQSINDGERTVEVTVGDRTFVSAPWMVDQTESLKKLWKQLAEKGCPVTAHGDGLLPYLYRQIATQTRKAA